MTIGKGSKLATTGSDIDAEVTIGKYCSIAGYVRMYSRTQHSCIQFPELVSTAQLRNYPQTFSDEKIIIENDVWIGRNATLLGGITIGNGAIIGAEAVVAKDVEPYSIVIGNPIRVLRYRFPPEKIEALQKIKWWDWDDEKMIEHEACLAHIDKLIADHLTP